MQTERTRKEGVVQAAALFFLAFAVTVLLYSYSKFVTPAYASFSANGQICEPERANTSQEVYFVGCGGFF
jgi:hypothetical protein